MSAFYITSKESLTKTFEQASKYLLMLAVPIWFGIFTLADVLIPKLFGHAFIASIVPLRILISGLVVIFLNFPVGALLNACNRQIINTINMAITVVFNVALNVILIRHYSFNGAAISALISGFLLFSLGLYQVCKIITINTKYLLLAFIKCIMAGIVMVWCLWLFKNQVSIFVSIPLGAIAYCIALYIFKGVTRTDISTLFTAFRNKL